MIMIVIYLLFIVVQVHRRQRPDSQRSLEIHRREVHFIQVKRDREPHTDKVHQVIRHTTDLRSFQNLVLKDLRKGQ